jgi:DNA-binding SARP family transcriptional activator
VLRFRILGPLEVEQEGKVLQLGGKQRQSLLAVLLLHANEPVASEQLIDELWGDTAPDTAAKIIQNNVSQLRKLLRPGVLRTSGRGYLLGAAPDELDARNFERLAGEGREALARDDAPTASATLREALALWRGPALADFVYEPFAQSEITRLEELRLAVIEDRIESDLRLGRHADLVGELEAFVVQHPLRERLRAHLMLALYRSARQADALEVYKRTRQHLIDELGIEPGPALQRLEKAVLAHDASLELETNANAHVLAVEALPHVREEEPERETRKTASVLFTELLGLTSTIDPETLSALQSRMVASMSPVLVRHGGAVEEVVPNGVMAVFGVPTTHEDDALRAVRAAADLRDTLATLNNELERDGHPPLAVRTGVSTGTVVTGSPRTITGEVVTAAASLAHAAQPGEILIGEETAQLIRTAAQLEPAEALSAGRRAWRVVDLVPGAPAIPRRFDTAMVGRERELVQLRQAFARAMHDWTPHLFTILGAAGIGKSRLAHELASSLAAEATVLTGHCLPYGEGITFWPLAEIVRQLAGENPRDGLVQLLAGEEDAEVVAERIAGAIGAVERASASEETFLAVRRLLEVVARERPLVLVLEDLHWAEPTLLDLLEHVADWTRDTPILLLCLARPELLEHRPAWGGGMVNASSILLEPLSDPESETLIENLLEEKPLEEKVRARILDAAAGNPLFLEQMLALITEGGAAGGELVVPPSIQALLAARLDRLPPRERAVLECAAIAGREFWSDAITELSPADARESVETNLHQLVRRDLIRAGRPSPEGEGVYRFRHILIRDAAYESLTKPVRAELHERFGDWLERWAAERGSEREEIVGYHLEQAYRLRAELGPVGVGGLTLAARAADHLAAAGRRAFARDDGPGAVNLLSRAGRLMDERAPDRPELMADLAEALRETGDFTQAEEILAEIAEGATASGDRGLATYAHLMRLRLQVAADPKVDTEELEREARRAVDVFEELSDERRLAKAWELLAWALWMRCQAGATEGALLEAIEHAQRAGDGRTEAQSLNLLLGAVFFGPLPVPEGISRCQEIVGRTAEQPRILSSALRALAGLRAMEGSFDEARTLLALCGAILEDLGLKVTAASLSETAAIIEMLAGDPAAAERVLRSGYAQLEHMGETSNSADLAAMLARALEEQGQADEALRFSEISSRIAAEDDLSPQVQWRAARAKTLAGFGEISEAERLAREAVMLASQSDFLVLRGDALLVLGEVLVVAGRPAEAAAAGEAALQLYEQKENSISAGRARVFLSDLA